MLTLDLISQCLFDSACAVNEAFTLTYLNSGRMRRDWILVRQYAQGVMGRKDQPPLPPKSNTLLTLCYQIFAFLAIFKHCEISMNEN